MTAASDTDQKKSSSSSSLESFSRRLHAFSTERISSTYSTPSILDKIRLWHERMSTVLYRIFDDAQLSYLSNYNFDAVPDDLVMALVSRFYGIEFRPDKSVPSHLYELQVRKSQLTSGSPTRIANWLKDIVEQFDSYRLTCRELAKDEIEKNLMRSPVPLDDILRTVQFRSLFTNALYNAIPASHRMALAYPYLGKNGAAEYQLRVMDSEYLSVGTPEEMQRRCRDAIEHVACRAYTKEQAHAMAVRYRTRFQIAQRTVEQLSRSLSQLYSVLRDHSQWSFAEGLETKHVRLFDKMYQTFLALFNRVADNLDEAADETNAEKQFERLQQLASAITVSEQYNLCKAIRDGSLQVPSADKIDQTAVDELRQLEHKRIREAIYTHTAAVRIKKMVDHDIGLEKQPLALRLEFDWTFPVGSAAVVDQLIDLSMSVIGDQFNELVQTRQALAKRLDAMSSRSRVFPLLMRGYMVVDMWKLVTGYLADIAKLQMDYKAPSGGTVPKPALKKLADVIRTRSANLTPQTDEKLGTVVRRPFPSDLWFPESKAFELRYKEVIREQEDKQKWRTASSLAADTADALLDLSAYANKSVAPLRDQLLQIVASEAKDMPVYRQVQTFMTTSVSLGSESAVLRDMATRGAPLSQSRKLISEFVQEIIRIVELGKPNHHPSVDDEVLYNKVFPVKWWGDSSSKPFTRLLIAGEDYTSKTTESIPAFDPVLPKDQKDAKLLESIHLSKMIQFVCNEMAELAAAVTKFDPGSLYPQLILLMEYRLMFNLLMARYKDEDGDKWLFV